ncbi:MAG: segregation/condensation protein A [Geminicoccaceae bacterium]|nr:segregation/condensation protein A [Geminicoccaceae bacterium]
MGEKGGPFVVALDGFEGPLDLLLDLARKDRIDLKRLSVLRLAEQYLAYLETAASLRLEVAADYLVMAAWLAYLKSELLLPKAGHGAPDPEALADDLALRLQRLDAARWGADWLKARPRLAEARFPRGMPDGLGRERAGDPAPDLPALLDLYPRLMTRRRRTDLRLVPRAHMTLEAALERLARLATPFAWRELRAFLPPGLETGLPERAALAASFVAGLELARRGAVEIEQAAAFAPLRLRSIPTGEGP